MKLRAKFIIFAGIISVLLIPASSLYRRQYENANDFTTVLNLYDKDKQKIYTYNNTGKGDGQLVQSIIHQGMSRSTNGGNEAARDPYINVTALLHDKLDMDVKLDVDEEHKVVTIRMNKAEAKS
ncbi:hypothetical protein [Paenibacillus pabuli]|uniref:hypothetical protein n=1 Tax=Paenibacillus pabuli TaxID=1472 RepID=UPI003CFB648C